MSLNQGEMLYEGKAKIIYRLKDKPDCVLVEYKDSLTAFNAQKKGEFKAKGELNRNIATLIFKYLGRQGVKHHWVEDVGPRAMICREVKIVPLEVVVRNRLAGSTAKKFNIEEGVALPAPLVEFYFKDDALGDPFLSDDQALMLKAVGSRAELDQLREQALLVNRNLKTLFSEIGIDLIDFKIEFGRTLKGELLLADEITPDCCRLWDMKTGEKMDKDRFRRDLGNVEESYREVWQRLQKRWENEL
ncbi:MAG: phosphoribosylaminoimidazolesuccinocarboxamide synthase [Bdellovibrionales bacterium]